MYRIAGSLLTMVAAANCFALQLTRDAKRSLPELIQSFGYTAETHHVQTEDGYILTLYRIPHGVRSDAVGEPLLVMHGLLCSSADFLDTLPDQALGYVLADAGYDVWLGNFRGNTYSKKHKLYSTTSKEFWDFSFHENGVFDLPAMIDYILDKTNKNQIFYVGHSMGTTTFYVLMTMRPEYNEKIKVMISLAPMSFVNHMISPLFIMASYGYRIEEWLASAFGIYEFLPNNELLNAIKRVVCHDHAPTQFLCVALLSSLGGWDLPQVNTTQLPVIFSYFPAGASMKQLFHYFQEVVSGHFRQWDYGKRGNINFYGTSAPPDYNLTLVVVPVVLFYSENDWFSNPTDVDRLNASLGNPVKMIRIPYEQFNHMDYMWAIDAKTLLYDYVTETLKEYT